MAPSSLWSGPLEEVYAAALLQVLGEQLAIGSHGHLAADIERVPVAVAPERQARADPGPHLHRHLHPATGLRGVPRHVPAVRRRRHALEREGRRRLGRLVQRRRCQGLVLHHVGAAVLHREVEPVEEEGDVPVRVAEGELPRQRHGAGCGAAWQRGDAGSGEGRHVEPRPVRADGEVDDEEDHAGDEERGQERRAQQPRAPPHVRSLCRQRTPDAGGDVACSRRRRGGLRRHGDGVQAALASCYLVDRFGGVCIVCIA